MIWTLQLHTASVGCIPGAHLDGFQQGSHVIALDLTRLAGQFEVNSVHLLPNLGVAGESFIIAYFGYFLPRDSIAFIMMIFVLIFMPFGVMGRRQRTS